MDGWRDLLLALEGLAIVFGWVYSLGVMKQRLDQNTETLSKVEEKLEQLQSHETSIALLKMKVGLESR